MASIRWGLLVSAAGKHLPFTHIRVGGRTLAFCGRPGAKLKEAVAALEKLEADEAASAAQLRRSFPYPSDPRD
jgi:hypothetical protein